MILAVDLAFHQPATSREPVADLSKHFFVHSEREVEDVMDVIVFHPLEALVELLIEVLQVAQVTQARVTNRSRHTGLVSGELRNREAGNWDWRW